MKEQSFCLWKIIVPSQASEWKTDIQHFFLSLTCLYGLNWILEVYEHVYKVHIYTQRPLSSCRLILAAISKLNEKNLKFVNGAQHMGIWLGRWTSSWLWKASVYLWNQLQNPINNRGLIIIFIIYHLSFYLLCFK